MCDEIKKEIALEGLDFSNLDTIDIRLATAMKKKGVISPLKSATIRQMVKVYKEQFGEEYSYWTMSKRKEKLLKAGVISEGLATRNSKAYYVNTNEYSAMMKILCNNVNEINDDEDEGEDE